MIIRDLLKTIASHPTLEAVLLWGPRQVGKTTLLESLPLQSKLLFDDLSVRQEAQRDPGFLLDKVSLPCLLDEVQYVAPIFAELKLRIDAARRLQLATGLPRPVTASYYLTGSNRTLLEATVQESLAGRCSLFELHGLSIKEIRQAQPDMSLKDILFKGGFPELYVRPALSPIGYINDYITAFVERDLARSAGIEKINEFLTVLRLLAARTGQFLNVAEVSKEAGVDAKTISKWLGMLERNFIVRTLNPWFTNLSKRIVKMPKLHFYDAAISARLQGHLTADSALNSPQAGALFETLVFAEIAKTRSNFLKDWQIFTWRTKDQEELDFVIQDATRFVLIEVKLGIHSAQPIILGPEAKKVFPSDTKRVVVTAGGTTEALDRATIRVPVFALGSWLLANLS